MDLLIIYFACGAPFGVYQITATNHRLNTQAALRVFLRICFWPVFAGSTLIQWFSREHSSKTDLDRRIDGIRTEIENLAFGNDSASSIFDFREILHRYAGLSEAANAGIASNSADEVFKLSKNGSADIASACLARKNQRKLSFHQSLARDEFVDIISELANADKRILSSAVELANSINDPETANILTAMIAQTDLAANQQISAVRAHSASSHL